MFTDTLVATSELSKVILKPSTNGLGIDMPKQNNNVVNGYNKNKRN